MAAPEGLATGRQAGWAAEEGPVSFEGRPPEAVVGHSGCADLIVSDDLTVGFLQLHHVAELGGLGRLPLADHLGVGLEDAQDLIGMMGIALEHASARLREDAADQARGLLELAAERRDDDSRPVR